MASNPEEHFGTEFFTPDKKVATGGRFYQRESVAGVRADMEGHFTKSRNVERRLYEHGQKELVYFKTQIERLTLGSPV